MPIILNSVVCKTQGRPLQKLPKKKKSKGGNDLAKTKPDEITKDFDETEDDLDKIDDETQDEVEHHLVDDDIEQIEDEAEVERDENKYEDEQDEQDERDEEITTDIKKLTKQISYEPKYEKSSKILFKRHGAFSDGRTEKLIELIDFQNGLDSISQHDRDHVAKQLLQFSDFKAQINKEREIIEGSKPFIENIVKYLNGGKGKEQLSSNRALIESFYCEIKPIVLKLNDGTVINSRNEFIIRPGEIIRKLITEPLKSDKEEQKQNLSFFILNTIKEQGESLLRCFVEYIALQICSKSIPESMEENDDVILNSCYNPYPYNTFKKKAKKFTQLSIDTINEAIPPPVKSNKNNLYYDHIHLNAAKSYTTLRESGVHHKQIKMLINDSLSLCKSKAPLDKRLSSALQIVSRWNMGNSHCDKYIPNSLLGRILPEHLKNQLPQIKGFNWSIENANRKAFPIEEINIVNSKTFNLLGHNDIRQETGIQFKYRSVSGQSEITPFFSKDGEVSMYSRRGNERKEEFSNLIISEERRNKIKQAQKGIMVRLEKLFIHYKLSDELYDAFIDCILFCRDFSKKIKKMISRIESHSPLLNYLQKYKVSIELSNDEKKWIRGSIQSLPTMVKLNKDPKGELRYGNILERLYIE